MKLDDFIRREGMRSLTDLAKKLGLQRGTLYTRIKYDNVSHVLIQDLTDKYGDRYVFRYENGEYSAYTIDEFYAMYKKAKSDMSQSEVTTLSRDSILDATSSYPVLHSAIKASAVTKFDVSIMEGYIHVFCSSPFYEIVRLPIDPSNQVVKLISETEESMASD